MLHKFCKVIGRSTWQPPVLSPLQHAQCLVSGWTHKI